jgi:hypothetical protein
MGDTELSTKLALRAELRKLAGDVADLQAAMAAILDPLAAFSGDAPHVTWETFDRWYEAYSRLRAAEDEFAATFVRLTRSV